jgi:hypothetical protein
MLTNNRQGLAKTVEDLCQTVIELDIRTINSLIITAVLKAKCMTLTLTTVKSLPLIAVKSLIKIKN